jgi:hypothetical protein
MGGNKSKTTEDSTKITEPWSGQQPYILDAFQKAYDVNSAQMGTPGYTGDFVAAPSQDMLNAFQSALTGQANTGLSQAAAGQSYNWGNQLLQQGSAFINDGKGYADRANNGLYDLSQSDLTGKNIANATRYANNPTMDGMIQSALRDGQRAVTEQVLPEINRSAGGTGNYNSSRTGIADGIVARGWSDQAADVSSQMRGQAYQAGIGASQNDTNAMIQALSSAGIQGLNMAQVGNAISNTGMAGLGQSAQINAAIQAMNAQNFQQQAMAATALNGFDQGALNNAIGKQEYKDNRDWGILGNYYGIVGDKSWGSTQTGHSVTEKEETPSLMSSIGSGIGILGSLFRCDRRVKTDIEMVAMLPDGIPLYTFRYLDDPAGVLHTAPMAQDVQKKYPEAVIEIDGVLHIDTNHYDWR